MAGNPPSFRHALALSAVIALGAFIARPTMAAVTAAQDSFATPQEAVSALVAAVQSGQPAGIAMVLGPGSEKLVESGDPVKDAEQGRAFLQAEATKHSLVSTGNDRMTLVVGANDWPMPIPIVKEGGLWHFDSRFGAEEIVDRRIGENEVAAIRFCFAYIDAQNYYFDLFKKARGTGVYAMHFASTSGNYDGLYWPSEPGVPESPLTPLVNAAVEEGYSGQLEVGKRVPFQGYEFRILTRQGPDAPNGARDYMRDGKMTAGYALIAWPARYGASGIMTFITSQDGFVFQKDLGPETAKEVDAVSAFNPDLSWARVDVTRSQ